MELKKSDGIPTGIWVCNKCCFPSQAIWEKHIKRCECAQEFSSPFEELCKDCREAEHIEPKIAEDGSLSFVLLHEPAPWQGWVWAITEAVRAPLGAPSGLSKPYLPCQAQKSKR